MRFAAALVALTAALAVSGCGGGEAVRPLPGTVTGTTETETSETETATTETATTETATTETEPGDDQQVPGDPEAGAEIFASAGCGSCHILEDAGTAGNIGPNLDATQPSYDLIVDRVTNGAGVMPAFGDQLTEQQIQDVAAYVFQATH